MWNLQIAAAHDVGKAINLLNCAAQIEGGLTMGIGAGVDEQLVVDVRIAKCNSRNARGGFPVDTVCTMAYVTPIVQARGRCWALP